MVRNVYKLSVYIIFSAGLCQMALYPEPSNADWRAASEYNSAIAVLEKLVGNLEKVERYTESYELGRLLVLKKQAQNVLASIQASGLAHMTTIRLYQTLIVHFRYSTAYLNRISTDETSPAIVEIQTAVESIVRDRGFDDSPYTQITTSVFTQIQQLIQEINKQTIDPKLREDLMGLLPDIGLTISQAKQGDRPKAFAAAISVYKRLKSFYPQFVQLTAKRNEFESVLNLQGLAEFYAEFAQIEEP
jgi:hypothetical protein